MVQHQETFLEIVPLLACCWFCFLRSFAQVLPYSTCLQCRSLWAGHQGPTTTSVTFAPISLFPRENCREWIASFSFFLCISRVEMSNKDQTPQVVVLTEKNNLINIFVLCLSVFSSEFSCRSLERYLYMYHLIPEGVVFSLVADSRILNIWQQI